MPISLTKKRSWFFRGKCQRIFVYWNRPRLISNRPWGFRVKIANFSRLHCLAVTNWLKPNESKTKCRKMSRKPWSHVRVLIYRTWAIVKPQGKKIHPVYARCWLNLYVYTVSSLVVCFWVSSPHLFASLYSRILVLCFCGKNKLENWKTVGHLKQFLFKLCCCFGSLFTKPTKLDWI